MLISWYVNDIAIKKYAKKYEQVDCMPGMQSWFNIQESIDVLHLLWNKGGNHEIVLINSEKVFEKIQDTCKMKAISNLEIEGNFLNLIKQNL